MSGMPDSVWLILGQLRKSKSRNSFCMFLHLSALWCTSAAHMCFFIFFMTVSAARLVKLGLVEDPPGATGMTLASWGAATDIIIRCHRCCSDVGLPTSWLVAEMQLASLVATFQVCFTCFILLCLRHPILAALVPATSLKAASLSITRQEMRTVWVAGPPFF